MAANQRVLYYTLCDFCGKGNVCPQYTAGFTLNLCDNNKECLNKYIAFAIFNDLTNGIPYVIRNKYSFPLNKEPFVCMYCASRENVIIHPRTPSFLMLNDKKPCNTFCKNSTCYKNCLEYMERLQGAPCAPFYFLRNIVLNESPNVEFYLPQEGEEGYIC